MDESEKIPSLTQTSAAPNDATPTHNPTRESNSGNRLKMCSSGRQRRWSRQKPFSPHVQNVNIQLGRWTSLGRRRSVSLGLTPLLTPLLPRTALSGSLDRLRYPHPIPHTHTMNAPLLSLHLLIGLLPHFMDYFNHFLHLTELKFYWLILCCCSQNYFLGLSNNSASYIDLQWNRTDMIISCSCFTRFCC